MLPILLVLAVYGADPWGRPTHLRAVAEPPMDWAAIGRARRRVRLWWDESAPGMVQAQTGRGWRTLARAARPGWTSRPLSRGTRFRVLLDGAARWSELVAPAPWTSPADLAMASGPTAAVLAAELGQVVADGGGVWASTLGGGVVRAEGGIVRSFTRWDGLPDDRVIAIDAGCGGLLLGTARGAAFWLPDRGVVRVWDAALPDAYVQAVRLEGCNAWVGTFHGLARVDEVDGAGVAKTVLSPWSVFSIAPASGGGAWVGYEGLARVKPEGDGWSMARVDGFDGLHVYDVHQRGAVVWAATEERGVLQVAVRGRPAEEGTAPGATGERAAPGLPPSDEATAAGWAAPSPAGKPPWSVAPDLAPSGESTLDPLPGGPPEAYALAFPATGNPWIAAGDSGLFDPTGRRWGRLDGLPSDTAWSVGLIGDAVWVGTDRGLARLALPTGTVFRLPQARWPAAEPATDLLLARHGAWVAGERGLWAIGHPDPHAADLVVAARGPVVAVVGVGTDVWAIGRRAVRLDRRGRLHAVELPAEPLAAAAWRGTLWVGGAGGVWRYDSADRFVKSFDLDRVTRLAPGDVALWAIAGQTVFRLVAGGAKPYLRTHPALDLAPAPGGVWVGSTNGLERIELPSGEVTDVLGEADEGVEVPAVASDGVDGCWFAAADGTVGHVTPTGRWWTSLPDPPRPTRIVVDPHHPRVAWVLTEAGTWRVEQPR